MKFAAGVISALAVASTTMAAPKKCNLPTTTIAGVEVVDTQLVRDAHNLVKAFIPLQPYLYNHLLRTWLLGAAALNNNATLKSQVDVELHAVGSLLHDLAWDQRDNSPFNTREYRFEIESGIAATSFVKNHPDGAKWSAARLEKLYDGISLQTIIGVANFKNIDTQWIVKSIGFEFPQPRSPLIPAKYYDSVQGNFTNSTLFRGTNDTFTRFAAKDPETTYNTFLAVFGEEYVPGYAEKGHRLFDLIQGGIQLELGQYPDVPFTPLPKIA
ncbi:hypothetical protein F4824DRAFT_88112 [Ustulina deusta]|nr:hypothetical protein F4823DRAFT_139997 [Ustulina deusta]KAI3338202.1 hypothetical protein F4824DRAFT_88112 [Ustulina deusta]